MHAWLWKSALVLAVLMALTIIGIGARFLLAPEASAESFGVPAEAGPYLAAKGIRDIGTGVVGLALVATGRFRAAGWAIIALALIPIGDALVVLAWGGPPVLAYAMHGGTALAMVAVGAVLVRGRPGTRCSCSSEYREAYFKYELYGYHDQGSPLPERPSQQAGQA